MRALLFTALVLAGVHAGPSALAQSNEELAQGRQLFTQALDDEDHHRYAAALEKYQRVSRIKDTSAIRFRMGATLESLGKPTQAIEAYTAAIHLAGPGDAKLAQASKVRIEALEPKVAHLTIRVRPSPADAEVRVDDEVLPSSGLEDARIDPGNHAIVVSAPGMQDAHASVTLSEGGKAEIPIALEPKAPPPPPPAPPAPPPPAESSAPMRPVTVGAAALGGVLVVSGIVVLGLRSAAISDLNASCPGGNCPVSREDDLRSTHDRAVAEGPIAITLLSVGVVALGAAAVFWFRDRSRVPAR